METITDLKDKLSDAAGSLGEGASDIAHNLQNHAKDAWDTVQDHTLRAVKDGVAYARKHPLPTALVTCGAGLIAGVLLTRRAASSLKPLHQSRGLLLGVLITCGALLKRTFSPESHVADIAKDAVKTVKRASRKTARKAGAAMVIAASLLPFVPSAKCEDNSTGGTFSLYMENDLFAGTDRQYTSGVKLAWSSRDLENYGDSPFASPLLPIFNLIPYINEKSYQKNLVFTLGQNIYTPDDTESFGLVEGDRPYAGWLYLGVGVVWKDAKVRNSLVLNLGVVGSWSYAQEAQRLVHDARGLGHPNGWDNQLHNELGVVATYQREWRWPEQKRRVGLDWEFIPHAGVALGNVHTYANLGGELRVGFNLPDDFGTASIGPATTTSTPVDGREGAQRSRFDLGMYAFLRADGRIVAHNIFLDGNTFGDSASVDRKWLVADLSAGVAVNYKNTKFAYAFVYRTEEFDTQKEPQVFGTVSVNIAF